MCPILKKIIDLIDESGLIELGAKNAIELGELKNILGSSSEFSGEDDTQIALNPQEDRQTSMKSWHM